MGPVDGTRNCEIAKFRKPSVHYWTDASVQPGQMPLEPRPPPRYRALAALIAPLMRPSVQVGQTNDEMGPRAAHECPVWTDADSREIRRAECPAWTDERRRGDRRDGRGPSVQPGQMRTRGGLRETEEGEPRTQPGADSVFSGSTGGWGCSGMGPVHVACPASAPCPALRARVPCPALCHAHQQQAGRRAHTAQRAQHSRPAQAAGAAWQ